MVYDSGLQPLASNHMSTGSLAVIPVGLSSTSVLLFLVHRDGGSTKRVYGREWRSSGRQKDHAFDVRLRPTSFVCHFSFDTDSVPTQQA